MWASRILGRLTIIALLSAGLAVAGLATPAGAQSNCTGPAGLNRIDSNDAVIRGTEGPDLICAGSGANLIFALGGDDIIYGLGGNDIIWGGANNDVIYGGFGNDKLRGGYGNDRLVGESGSDTLFGGPGRDVLEGGGKRDILIGGNGADELFGGQGFDRLQGGDAADLLEGGPGNDVLLGGKGQDILRGGSGIDKLFGGTSHDTLYGENADDELTGGDGFDTLYGGLGDDRLRGGNGDDVLFGGDDNDTLNGGPHDDRGVGGDGFNTCLNTELVRGCANVPDNLARSITDFGVTDETIRIGITADLSGPFSGLTASILQAQEAYFDRVNEQGGIDGRQIDLVVLDSAYDIPTQLDNYAELSEESDQGVAMISHSTGTPHTLAIARDLADDNLAAVPLSWDSTWSADAEPNVFALGSNYCFEAMNGIEFLADLSGLASPKVAVVTRASSYGFDSAAGALLAAETLGLETVDLTGAIAGDDFTPIVSTLLAEKPDIVWITSSPGELAQLLGSAAAGGLTALWSGSSPSYHPALLDTPVGPALDAFYFHSTYNALWDQHDSQGMKAMVREITARIPDGNYAQADNYVVGWTQAMFTEAVLELAVTKGDLTRGGLVAAAREVSVNFKRLAPNQSWSGSPDTDVVRATYFYDVVLADWTPTTPITEPGSTGLKMIEEKFIGSVASGYSFTEPCFIPGG